MIPKVLQSKRMKPGYGHIGPSFYARHGSLIPRNRCNCHCALLTGMADPLVSCSEMQGIGGTNTTP